MEFYAFGNQVLEKNIRVVIVREIKKTAFDPFITNRQSRNDSKKNLPIRADQIFGFYRYVCMYGI